MSLDVLKVDSLSDTRSLVHVASEPVEVWVGHDALLVALEMGYVDSVEPDQCSEQAYIGKSHLGTTQVPLHVGLEVRSGPPPFWAKILTDLLKVSSSSSSLSKRGTNASSYAS